MADDFERACAQVGRFMYHFAQLENQIDAAVARLFELKDNTAKMINGSVDFLKRYNLVHTAVRCQVDDNEYKRLKKILTQVTQHNNARVVVAHSRFEPEGGQIHARCRAGRHRNIAAFDCPPWQLRGNPPASVGGIC